jgi:hypothetical protein
MKKHSAPNFSAFFCHPEKDSSAWRRNRKEKADRSSAGVFCFGGGCRTA